MEQEKTILHYAKVREVKSPTRGTEKSAGIDFYVPTFTEQFLNDFSDKNPNVSAILEDNFSYVIINAGEKKCILLAPHTRVLIPSGIKIKGNVDIASVFKNKSGVSTKKGLDVLACVVDEDYQGEIHISLVNTSSNIIAINEGEKITQLLEYKILYSELIETPAEELYSEVSERGEGGFGHTGNE